MTSIMHWSRNKHALILVLALLVTSLWFFFQKGCVTDREASPGSAMSVVDFAVQDDSVELSRCPLKFSEWLPWLFHAAFFVGADCGSACSASMVAMIGAISAKPFTRLNCGSQ